MRFPLCLCLLVGVALWAAPAAAQSPLPFPTEPTPPNGPPPSPTDPNLPGGPPPVPTDPNLPGGPPALPTEPTLPGGAPSFPTDPSPPGGAPSFPGEPLPPGPGDPAFTLMGAKGWRTLALPFADLPLGGRGPGFLTNLWTAGYVGADRDQRNRRGLANVLLYDEPTGLYVPPRRETSVGPGEGMWVYAYADDDPQTPGVQGGFPKALDVSGGVPVTGSHEYGLGYTPSSPGPGFHLLGNPYEEAIDWDHPSWTRVGVSETVYVWDPELNPPDGAFRSWNGVVGDVHGGAIPSGQGFHVEALGPGPVLIVHEEAKTGARGVVFGKAAAPPSGLAFRLSGAVAGRARESSVFVSLHETAALGLDAHDGRRLGGVPGGDALRLVALVPEGYQGEGSALAIASVPKGLRGPVEVPLHAEALAGGSPSGAEAVLSWGAASLPAGWTASLRDRATGRVYDLHEEGSVALVLGARDALMHSPADLAPSFRRDPFAPPPVPQARPLSNEAGREARFVIALSPGPSSHEKGRGLEVGTVAPNPSRSGAAVWLSLPEAGEVTVAVFDALGRLVTSSQYALGEGAHSVEVPTRGLAPGTYAVIVETAGGTATRRLTVVR